MLLADTDESVEYTDWSLGPTEARRFTIFPISGASEAAISRFSKEVRSARPGQTALRRPNDNSEAPSKPANIEIWRI